MEVYACKTVRDLESFYGPLLLNISVYNAVSDHLSTLATRLYEGIKEQEEAVFTEINNYYPPLISQSKAEIIAASLSLADCHEVIAHEYGYKAWDEVKKYCQDPYQIIFEEAVNDVIFGNIESLLDKINAEPDIVSMRSQYGHNASLLHYAGSNGVELWRQRVPGNLPQIITLLLDRGADREAKMNVYGGQFNTLSMVETSAHPHAAGIADQLIQILKAQ